MSEEVKYQVYYLSQGDVSGEDSRDLNNIGELEQALKESRIAILIPEGIDVSEEQIKHTYKALIKNEKIPEKKVHLPNYWGLP